MKSSIDLHLHTNCSDGSNTPLDLIYKLFNLGIKLCSITDHDSIKAYDMLESSSSYYMKMIQGVELSFVHNNYIRHMLAYNFNMSKMREELDILYTQKKLFEHEEEMLHNFFKLSKETGLVIDDRLKIEKGTRSEAFNKVYDSLLSNPKNLEICPSLISHTKFYWHECMNRDSKFFIDSSEGLPNLKEVLNLIKRCEGLSILAHPFQYPIKNNSYEINKEVINLAIRLGLDGIEVYHKSSKKEQIDELITIANENNLFITGGSDYHGNKEIHDNCITELQIKKFLDYVSPYIFEI